MNRDNETIQSHQILDLTENICKLLEGYRTHVGFFSLINCLALISLKGEEYSQESRKLISDIAIEVFSDQGLEIILSLKELLLNRSLNLNKNKKH